MTAISSIQRPINLMSYIEEIKPTLIPPVSNRLLYGDGQLKVMLVGGPNKRQDYHIEEGEELFYQIEGDMNLNVVENGKIRHLPILEGQSYFLPARVPHSPQRYENTVGIVFERRRLPHEYDGLRWYVNPTAHTNDTRTDDVTDDDEGIAPLQVLYEEYFHCTDLGQQLAPIINRFFQSEVSSTNIPPPHMPVAGPPVVATDLCTSTYTAPSAIFAAHSPENDEEEENRELEDTASTAAKVTALEETLPRPVPGSSVTTAVTAAAGTGACDSVSVGIMSLPTVTELQRSQEFVILLVQTSSTKGAAFPLAMISPVGVELFLWQKKGSSTLVLPSYTDAQVGPEGDERTLSEGEVILLTPSEIVALNMKMTLCSRLLIVFNNVV